MFTFIVIVILLCLFGMLIDSKNSAASKKSKTTQHYKPSTSSNDTHQSVNRQRVTTPHTTQRDKKLEKQRALKERREKEQHQAIAETERKRQKKLKEKEDGRKQKEAQQIVGQTKLLLLQSITSQEQKSYNNLVLQALVADHEQVHCIYCRATEGIIKRGKSANGSLRYRCTSCAQAFQSEYSSDKKKLAVSFDKQQRDIRTRIQCKVRSKIEAKVKTCAAEQVIQSSCYSVSGTSEQSYITVEPSELLSTTAYAKTRKLKAWPHLFDHLYQHRVIKKVAGKYELTDIGRSFGGQYRTGKDGDKWIVWPENALDSYVTQLQQKLISDMPFDHLCHMTHIDNVAGILRHGLQSHINNHKLKDISNLDVNIRRKKKETVNLRPIHSYVPFYFNARNAMLFQVQKQYGDQVVILGYEKSLICHQGSVYSDGNAAANLTKFFDELSTLYDHDWREVFSSNWANYGNVDSNLKRKMMSEALIPGVVPASELRVIYCASPSTKHYINKICSLPHVEVKIAPSLFF